MYKVGDYELQASSDTSPELSELRLDKVKMLYGFQESYMRQVRAEYSEGIERDV